jgi:hypothetical protein
VAPLPIGKRRRLFSLFVGSFFTLEGEKEPTKKEAKVSLGSDRFAI